jgi:CheY-like chemotaxis protein
MPASGFREQTITYPMTNYMNNPKPLVLVVENNEDSRQMLKTLLEIWGYRVAESEDGEESIESAVSECPNLILMDVSLSKMDGLTTVRRMREIDTLRGVPIVFISGHAQPEFRTFALTVGGDDFLVKPVDFNQLETVLERYINKNTVNINSGGITV